MQSKPCVCGQTLWSGDRYCVGCGRPVSWTTPSSKKEKILDSSKIENK